MPKTGSITKLGKISCIFPYEKVVVFGDAWLRLDYELGFDRISRNPQTNELEIGYIPFDYQ